MTRGDFLGFGVMGAIVGAVLTIPPVAFILEPVIKTNVLGGSNVEDVWKEVGPGSEIPKEEPVVFTVEFPITQSYGNRQDRKSTRLNSSHAHNSYAVFCLK